MAARHFAVPALAVALAALLAACGASDTRYYIGAFEPNQELRELFRLFEREKDQDRRFVLIQQIARSLANAGKREEEILFLTTHVARNPSDGFNAYYLLLVADTYRDMKAVPFAIHYYRRILSNHPDLLVRGQSIHLYCLQELIPLETNPYRRIEYYKDLIGRFPDQAEHSGSNWYYMAKSYEEIGEWDLAMQAYDKYRISADTEIPGDLNAYRKVTEKLNFYYNADKDRPERTWLLPDLDALVAAVKDAILTRNFAKIRKYQAGANFFQEGWDQQAATGDASGEGFTEFNIREYLSSSNVKIGSGLDVSSNDREAYLRTTDWNFRPPTWYLVFRKVDFPANPDINGQWEWAGIRFGEKL